MKINLIKMCDDALIPTRGTNSSAGYDLYAYLDASSLSIQPHETKLVGTKIKMEIPEGYFGAVYARSGIATKRSIRPANCTGVIDSDYRGEILVPLHNDSNEVQIIENKERIAQIVIMPYLNVDFNVTNKFECENTSRDEKGFGSTGTK